MWKKSVPSTESPSQPTPNAAARASIDNPPKRTATPAPTLSTSAARIGPSLVIKGEVYGEEDLVVDGKVNGAINVKSGSVTVGEKGRVEADIQAVSIQVAGRVKGNLSGADRVVLMESGRVEGDIIAKNVTLENGCRFKGSIDMESARPQAVEASGTASKPKPNGGGPAVQSGGSAHGTVRTS